jgi:hypothetical protein
MPVRQWSWGLVQQCRDCAVGLLQRSLLCLTCIEISLLQCCDDRFPSSLYPTKVLSLIKDVFLLGKTIICLLAGWVCVWCVVSILKTWIHWPLLGKPKWYQITNCCHSMGPCRWQACIMTLLLMEGKSDNPFEDWRLSKITHEFLLHGEQPLTFNKTIHRSQLRESIVVLDENRTKHINRAVWQTAEFVTLQQMVHIVTTWLNSLILVVEAIFFNVLQCDAI